MVTCSTCPKNRAKAADLDRRPGARRTRAETREIRPHRRPAVRPGRSPARRSPALAEPRWSASSSRSPTTKSAIVDDRVFLVQISFIVFTNAFKVKCAIALQSVCLMRQLNLLNSVLNKIIKQLNLVLLQRKQDVAHHSKLLVFQNN